MMVIGEERDRIKPISLTNTQIRRRQVVLYFCGCLDQINHNSSFPSCQKLLVNYQNKHYFFKLLNNS